MSASKTAEYVALYRALEDGGRFRDPYAQRFLSRRLRLAVCLARWPLFRRRLEAFADSKAPGARTSAIGRTVYIDQVVRDARVPQLIILGAGFDTRAHRMPELRDTQVFEVDRAETQAKKRSLMGDRSKLAYVAVDFLRDMLEDRLSGAGFDPRQRTLVLWEGVTNYLDESAVHRVLRWAGRLPPGSQICFTYIHKGVLDGGAHFPGASAVVARVAGLGEPWRFGILPTALPGLLREHGLRLVADIDADTYREQAGLARDGYAFYRLCVAASG